MTNDIEEIKKTLEKRRYHQKILLDIACHENPDELFFFQQIIMYDLDEKQVKLLLAVLQYLEHDKIFSIEKTQELEEFDIKIKDIPIMIEEKLKLLEDCIQKLKIDIPLKYLLLSLEKQNILSGVCKNLLSVIK